MRSTSLKAHIRLWWRRHNYRFRHLSPIWFVFVLLSIVFLVTITPNPFSARYRRISIHQDIWWENANGLLQTKAKILENDRTSKSIQTTENRQKEREFTSTILIVLYTTIFREKKFCSFSIDQIFGQSCPVKTRCQWSCDERRYREADALIFHAYDIPSSRTSMPSRSETKPNSIWILWSDEPPSIIDYSRLISYHFNWTISYKLNSEVSLATYGLFSKRETPLSNNAYEQWLEHEFSNRENGALWFVSNCNAKKRLDLFHNLKRRSKLLIEGYGRCVDYYPLHLCSASSHCERDYMSKFKFYLSFESNTCRDYITEKFYKAFYYGLIPIAYGPKKNDYERLAPNNSFLHIDDFQNDIERLANLLEEIHSNRTLFSIFHQWRRDYEIVIDGKALERIRMCELCQRLVEVKRGDSVYYRDIEQFYDDQCNYI